jgi:hypothetical protein
MWNAVKACTPWLDWKIVAALALVIVGIVVCTGLPTLRILAGAAPLLIVAACLIPCLVPLVLLCRNRKEGSPAISLNSPQE